MREQLRCLAQPSETVTSSSLNPDQPARSGGAPEVPVQAREELLALKSGTVFLCARRDGELSAGPVSGEGLYLQDTRHLSQLELVVGGHATVPLSCAMESGHHAVVNATLPALRSGDTTVAQETINVRRTILISDRLHYEVRLQSFNAVPLTTTVQVTLAADFADVFEVRRFGRETGGEVLAPIIDEGRLVFAYVATDGIRRETTVTADPPPTQVELDGYAGRVGWEVTLRPGEPCCLTLVAGAGRLAGRAPELEPALASLEQAHRDWTDQCAQVTTDSDLFDRFIDASVRDLHALMMPAADAALPAAGIPWYVAPFGRDSLLTSCETLMLNPDVARGTLRALAAMQATEDDAWRDAEPGKILHELRCGELARTGQVPHTPYYGTVDATPLFLMIAGGYFRWTLDLDTMAALRPAFDAALEWIDTWGDRDGDGFLEYERRSPAGLVNQGWKDSHDCIVHADGSLAQGPIALAEVQAYVYEAKLRIAEVYAALGEPDREQALRAQADALRTAFNAAFWDPQEDCYVLALDGRKQQVRSVTSNVGHCLYCGIADEDKAARVAERLMASDMFSGWGVRTLSSDSPAYNPMSYHNGSVWPHDNAIVAAGLKRYGFHAATARIAEAMFEVAVQDRDLRLPELFCGFPRHASRSVVAYPVACIPQAWAAAAPFMLLQALLGITAHAPSNRLTVDRPTLPPWLESVELSGVRVAGSHLRLAFRRGRFGTTGFSLLSQDGQVQVTMSA